MIRSFLIVGLGSFLGGGLRFLFSRLVQTYVHHPFPLATWVVNVLGCLLIGMLNGYFERSHLLNPDIRLFLTVGLCGGFTTFSTFMNENFQLLKGEQFFILTLYASLSLLIGLLAVWAGYALFTRD